MFNLITVGNFFGQKTIEIVREIDYERVTLETGNGALKVGFAPISGNWNSDFDIPIYSFSQKIGTNGAYFKLKSYLSEPISSEERKYIIDENVSNKINYKVNVVSERYKYYATVEIDALIKNEVTGHIEKITQITGEIETFNSNKTKPKSFASNSVLASGSGDWYRIGVPEDGLYKIDYSFLQNLGVNMQNLSTNSIHIYGNGQSMLNHNNSAIRVDDLLQRSIYISGASDGNFDPSDYLVFYANGPHKITHNNVEYLHENNNYTDTSYYFINISNTTSSSIVSTIGVPNGNVTHTITKFNDFKYIEEDTRSLAKSGVEWLGDLFDVQLSKSYDFSFANISTNDSIVVTARIGISTPTTTNNARFTMSVGNQSVDVKPISGSGQGSVSPKCRLATNFLRAKPTGDNVSVLMNFNKDGLPSSLGYLDYITVNAIRNLRMEGSQMLFVDFNSVGIGNIGEFILSNAQNVKFIWDITDPVHPKNVSFNKNGSTVTFKSNLDELKTFIAFTDDQYKTPKEFGNVPNQNLHGLESRDLIIISAPEFYPAAQRLAAHHQTEGLSSYILNQQEIFNEFSSGMRDPVAIKHFLKMFYDRAAGNPNDAPRFCLLLGDCSYDYRNRLNSKSDYVITYESVESFANSTFSTDDFYVILDDNEGMNGSDMMDMAIGRIPVENLDDANNVVDKIINYSTLSNQNNNNAINCCGGGADANPLGDWRNVIVMVSDDGDGDAYFTDIENMSNIMKSSHNDINLVKMHSSAYPEVITPGGERNYDIEEALKSRVQRGALVVNYIGHGGELGWAHEQILNIPTIQGWTNSPNLPLFMTATCEFSRYDDHDRVSAGEYVVLNRDGGGISLFTTTRLVFTTDNRNLARVFYDTVADYVDGKPQYIGDIYKGAKNKFASRFLTNEGRKFTFLGDPAVRLALPNHVVKVDSINGIAIDVFNDTLNALSLVTVSGHVENINGNSMNDFNGFVTPTIYDKISELKTLGHETGVLKDFETWQNIIYRGKASVTNGKFSFSFMIPQDITFTYGPGRLSFYAENGQLDGKGVDETPIIGGINSSANADDKGPDVALFMNNEKFVDGGMTDQNPIFIAKVFDENGINMIGSGIGHNIELRIDDESEPIILNEYYESDVDTYKSGRVKYQLSKIAPGPHVARFKVWDVYNNSSDSEIEFTVVEDEEISIEHLINYPNPFTTNTEFSFQHNQVCDFLDVQIQIFTITGKLVKDISQRVQNSGFRTDGIYWDGRDDFGDKIGIGTYVYKLTVVNEGGEKHEKYQKLVILN